jgi:hypothetical protein
MRKHLAIAAIVAVLAVPGMRAATAAGPQAGEVLALFGQCFVETAGRRDPLKLGDAVHVGDTVDVAAGRSGNYELTTARSSPSLPAAA